ncbi:hypothetical protein [Mucilaginibacter sp.]|nr:hypothetical protein [Mucilaginibacter sp.]
MIERKKGQDYFIKLMINYGSLSDGMLRREIGRLDTELEFELDRAFTY